VYNCGRLLLEAYESLRRQSDVNFEWVIVADGCDKETRAVLDRIGAKGVSWVRIVEQARAGAGVARNRGITEAAGQWIKFLDGDDYLEMGHLRAQSECARKNPGSVVVSGLINLFDGGAFRRFVRGKEIAFEPDEDHLATHICQPKFSHCGCLFPANLVRLVGGFDAGLTSDQDGDFLFRLFLTRPRLVPEPQTRIVVRLHNHVERVSSSRNLGKLESRVAVCDRMVLMLQKEGTFDRYRYCVAQRYDKVAEMAILVDRELSRGLFSKARAIAPDYRPAGNRYVPLLRGLLGRKLTARLRMRVQRWKGL
jgi:glycosyltransferase involved in cell wall biosynthesis